ncbi:hypothetical protein [Cellulophaga sp. Z1A5H]|uniref:hypothetical protein n=1 Tax=Cellulophaga sp. Z1A5H TaxID=2687291 RepID=UPI0013FD9187|nr:hypothetical protein [Cellulophaga sp. Z1A5H]
MDLIIGNYYDNIKCESFLDPETNRIRVRPLPNQGLPTKIVVECKKEFREAHQIGTIFRTENVKVCKKPDGRLYLRAKDQMIYKIQ